MHIGAWTVHVANFDGMSIAVQAFRHLSDELESNKEKGQYHDIHEDNAMIWSQRHDGFAGHEFDSVLTKIDVPTHLIWAVAQKRAVLQQPVCHDLKGSYEIN